MAKKDEEFLEALRATFKVEAAEHVQAIAAGLLDLEKQSDPAAQRDVVATVFRAAHSLKGAARAVDFTQVEALCQSLEDKFAFWKRQERAPSATDLDALHNTLNAITTALAARADGPAKEPAGTPVKAATPAPAREREAYLQGDTVRISVAKLDACLVEAEEMLTAKLAAGQRAEDLRQLSDDFGPWKTEWAAVEPEARRLRQNLERAAAGAPAPASSARLLDFLDWNLECVRALENRVAALVRTADQDRHVVDKLVDDLLEDSKKLLLLPFGTLTAAFPKLVRDLCRDQGKDADLALRGEEVEIDKRVLEAMKDPLIHLLRNCLVHGIESPETRRKQGKPGRGALTLAVTAVNGSKVELLVSDDGAGIDVGRVKEAAMKHGILSAEAAAKLTEAEARDLIFQSDVSTSPIITSLAGRGLGLAIVRENAEKLGGSVSVESQPGRGTVFRILLPSMLATFRGILVESARQRFILPTAHVQRALRVNPGEIKTVEGRETISFAGRAVAWARLADVLELPPAPGAADAAAAVPAIVMGAGEHQVAFAVDAIHSEQEVLLKRLGKPLSRVRHISGASVLGSGQVVPVLNPADLLKSARKAGSAPARVAAAPKPHRTLSVLVAEDSITSRAMIKGILEAAGYAVKTAVDGMDALTQLHTEKFDLLVSDAEMPRLNGFDLTARIRADKKLSELPVVLVTALESREDRERGIDVGANAYIVKSKFDHGTLLETVRRLA